MTLDELNAINRKTLAALEGGAKPDIPSNPYYGYYDVEIFECPKFVMFTNNDCPRGWDIMFGRYFEPHSMRIWCRLARTATGILDIGSHVGVYSLAAASLRKDIIIHAFEPNPHAYGRLRVHKMVNQFAHINEHTVAVGDREEFVHFSWVKKPTLQISSGGGVGRREGKNIEHIVVPMAKLDGSGLAATLGAKPLVKIDVEGGEVSTINGMREVLALHPDVLLETFHQNACDSINDVILPLGYRVFMVHEKAGLLEERSKLMPCSPSDESFNQFLTTRSDAELAALRP